VGSLLPASRGSFPRVTLAKLFSADIFASGDKSEDVATAWFHRYQADNVAATTDLVNCILSSAGCNHHITDDDIRDPENCQNRLADLQNVYAEVG
jgi:cohesin complex subunit SA-1/2